MFVGSNPTLSTMIEEHVIEIKYRMKYIIISLVLTILIGLYFWPTIITLAPIKFINHKWEDAFITFLSLAIISGLIVNTPLIIYHIIAFITPGLYQHEIKKIIFKNVLILIFSFFYWLAGPYLIFYLPTYLIYYHNEIINLTPILLEFCEIVLEYYMCTIIIIIIPKLIDYKFSRKFLYLFAFLLSSIFDTSFLIIVPLIIYIEISKIWQIWLLNLKACSSVGLEHSVDNGEVKGSNPLRLKPNKDL